MTIEKLRKQAARLGVQIFADEAKDRCVIVTPDDARAGTLEEIAKYLDRLEQHQQRR